MNIHKLKRIAEIEKGHKQLTKKANRLGLFSLKADIVLEQRDILRQKAFEFKQEYNRTEGNYSQDKEVYDLIMDIKKLNQVLLLGLLALSIVNLFL